MSAQAQAWVMDCSKSRGVERLVLLILANYHGDRGAWPALETLAEKSGVTKRSVQRALQHGIASGELSVAYKAGPHGTNVYQFCHLASSVTWTSTTPDVDIHDQDVDTAVSPELKNLKNQTEMSDFTIWYAKYPRHEGRGGAATAYRSARKKASAEELLTGAQRYRDNPARRKEFTKLPTTWLNQECWLDETETAAPDQPEPDYHFAEAPDSGQLEEFAAMVKAMPWVGGDC